MVVIVVTEAASRERVMARDASSKESHCHVHNVEGTLVGRL